MMKDKLTFFLLVILFFNVVASTSNNSTDSDPLPRVYLSWYPLPPFTTEDTNVIGNSPPKQIIPKLVGWLGAVCSHGHGIKLLPISTRGKNETDVLNHLENRKAQFAFPVVSSSKESTYWGYNYLPLLPYLSTVFLVKEKPPGDIMFEAVLKAWPLLVVTLLLTAIAGIITWGLVSTKGFSCLSNKLLLWLVCMGNSTFPLRQMRNLITLSSVTIEFTSSFTDCLRKHLG